jgi:hypothetical protein
MSGDRLITWMLTIAAAIVALTAGAAASADAAIKVAFQGGQAIVQPGSIATLTEQCPSRTPHPIGAQFGALTRGTVDQLALAGSARSGRRGWKITVRNMGTNPVGFGAAELCVDAPGARFAYPQATVVAQAQHATGLEIRCPRSAPSPIGATFSMQRSSPPGSAVVNWMAQQYDKHRRLTGSETAGMRNLTNAPVGFNIGAVCSTLRVTNYVQSGAAHVAPGSTDGWWFRCPVGAIAAGGEFWGSSRRDSSQITLAESFAMSARKWTVVVRSLASTSLRYGSGVVCVSQQAASR